MGIDRMMRAMTARLLMTLCACLALQTATAAVPPPPAPSKPAAPGFCAAPGFPDPAVARAASPPVSIALLTDKLVAGGPADLVLVTSSAAPDLGSLNYRVLVTRGTNVVVSPATIATLPVETRRPSDDELKKVGITDNRNVVVIRTALNETEVVNLLGLSDNWTISLAGCPQAGPGQATTGVFASRIVSVTEPAVARLWALVFVAALYLLAVTCVWAQRRKTADMSANRAVTPPVRLERIKAWSWWRCLDPVVLTSDIYDRGSLSQLQILFFAGIILFGMSELALSTGSLSSLSPAIVYLLGIPAAGTLSAQFANASRDRLSPENWAWLVSRGVLPENDAGNRIPQWRDLIVQDDSEIDLSKLQALGFSIVVGIGLIRSGFSAMGSFAIPSELLEILALSQVVFVGGRFTKPATMADIDALITTLRERLAMLRHAAKAGVDVNPDGSANAVAVAVAPVTSFAAAMASLPNAAGRYAETADQVAVLLRGLTHRSIDCTQISDPVLT